MRIELESVPNLIIAFHGCDKSIVDSVVLGKERIRDSNNSFDWLGHGQYFWENNKKRALSYARELKKKRPESGIKDPGIIGAIIKPGRCLDLTNEEHIDFVKSAHNELCSRISPISLRQNEDPDGSGDLLLRYMDRAVIEYLHILIKETPGQAIDTVRGVFIEGGPLYKNAGFREKTHIQICVVNPNCIVGYFKPR